jgi:hypothetical protein
VGKFERLSNALLLRRVHCWKMLVNMILCGGGRVGRGGGGGAVGFSLLF